MGTWSDEVAERYQRTRKEWSNGDRLGAVEEACEVGAELLRAGVVGAVGTIVGGLIASIGWLAACGWSSPLRTRLAGFFQKPAASG